MYNIFIEISLCNFLGHIVHMHNDTNKYLLHCIVLYILMKYIN